MIARIFLAVFILIAIFSCANQTGPTGGPKDEEPPILINSFPANQSINFNGTQIALIFDEVIKANNPSQQIIITPRIDQEVEYTVKRNQFIIDFASPLEENITYNINFREAIKDITEGNVSPLNFAFSTGPYLDSLQIRGNVSNMLTHLPLSGATVGLQLPTDTAQFFTYPPFYFTKADKQGNFQFNNLKSAEYIIYAFNDRNNDLILQPSIEEYGFREEILALTSDTSDIELPSVKVNLDTLKLISARQSGKYFNVNFNKPVINYEVNPLSQPLPYMLAEDFKTLIFFNIDQLTAPVGFAIEAIDSVYFTVDETVSVVYEETPRQPIDFIVQSKGIQLVKSNPVIETEVKFNKPINHINFDSIFYYHDSTTILPVGPEQITYDSLRTNIIINYRLPKTIFNPDLPTEGTLDPLLFEDLDLEKPTFYLGSGAFVSVENDLSNRQLITPKIYTNDQLGTIITGIETSYENYIVELLDSKYNVVRRLYNESTIRFEKLLPGNYMIRVIGDANANNYWDPGNIYLNEIPEPVVYYLNMEGKKDIPLRANFEIALDPIEFFPVDNPVE